MARPLLICLFLCFSFGSLSLAQTNASELLTQAISTAERARANYDYNIYDLPLWREAIRLGHLALEEDSHKLEASHFLATSYGYVNWYSRAWEHWLVFFALGGSLEQAQALDANSSLLFTDAGTELGFARYEARRPRAALPYYKTVLSHLANESESLRWLGRIHLELNEPDDALPYWRRLAEVSPDDEGVQYYLRLAELQDQVGIEASRAFQEGLQTYEEGDVRAALPFFEDAIEFNKSFKDAYVWAARAHFELANAAEAERYWNRVLELDPSDERALYFARYSGDRRLWGVAAADTFYSGQTLHLQMNFEAAAQSFQKAFELNPNYKNAAVWAARSYQEAELPDKAIPFWEAVLRLDPTDKRAQDFLRLAEAEESYGIEAGSLFLEGVAAFEASNLTNAQTLFQEAIKANPDFAEAWAWLGRVHFTQGNYQEAATRYSKAAELEPNNEGYAFFATESRNLAEAD